MEEKKEKCFRVVYDKPLKDYAELLKNLISQYDGCKAQLHSSKEKKVTVDTDKDYWVYLGRNCSKLYEFEDAFSDYGVRIGWSGTTAWIKVIDWEWAGIVLPDSMRELPVVRKIVRSVEELYGYVLYKNRKGFIDDYLKLYRKYRFRSDDDIDYAKDDASAKKRLEERFRKSCVIGEKEEWLSDLNKIIGYEGLPARRRRFFKKVYLFSIMKFVDEYMGSYLNAPRTYSIIGSGQPKAE